MNTNLTVSPAKRFGYACIGLLAGDAVLLLFLLVNALRLRSSLLAIHMGEPARQIPEAFDIFIIYAVISFGGWLLVGLPTALFVPARFFTGLRWPLRVLLGAALGPLALFVIFAFLAHGHINSMSFPSGGLPWIYSIMVSIPSFVVYAALLGKRTSITHR